MRFDKFSFGSIQIDGVTRDYDVVIDGGGLWGSGRLPPLKRTCPSNVVQPCGTRVALMGGPEKPESRRVVAVKRRPRSTDSAINGLRT